MHCRVRAESAKETPPPPQPTHKGNVQVRGCTETSKGSMRRLCFFRRAKEVSSTQMNANTKTSKKPHPSQDAASYLLGVADDVEILAEIIHTAPGGDENHPGDDDPADHIHDGQQHGHIREKHRSQAAGDHQEEH